MPGMGYPFGPRFLLLPFLRSVCSLLLLVCQMLVVRTSTLNLVTVLAITAPVVLVVWVRAVFHANFVLTCNYRCIRGLGWRKTLVVVEMELIFYQPV